MMMNLLVGLFFDRLTLPKLLEQCAQGLYFGFKNLFDCFGSKLFLSAVLFFCCVGGTKRVDKCQISSFRRFQIVSRVSLHERERANALNFGFGKSSHVFVI